MRGAVLFTPGDRPERFDKGWAASRGRLILDLEDAVAPERKAAARAAVAAWARGSGRRPLVRVNAIASPFFAEDRAALAGLALGGMVIPKVEHANDLDTVHANWPAVDLFPLIETPRGLEEAVAIGCAPGVRQLLLGALDLHADCGIAFPHPALVAHARLRLVLASRTSGIAAPVDSPHPSVAEPAAAADDARAAAALGFAAKLCIHPGQVDAVDEAFRPSPEELAWAREVLDAAGAGTGAVQVRGRMVDAPVIASARAILERAG
ncbi:CoA ester lyase [Ramlibacter ginsenosidimutans]|uniref:CoA ester lyase n=1 Tax=Ramlibacter ginsenosidimutans TaxID=502333 RepID=A0A934TSQ2_9BURK|nr:CoA ester lyase [Ramlibacter ginsenosidimutans]